MVLDTRKSAVCGRPFTLSRKEEVSNRWPHIERFLRIDSPTGWVNDDYHRWHFANEEAILPCAEVAAALDEWADFYEWRLKQRADELAGDRTKRHIVEEWTDSMVYCCQRWAARARGEDPGEWISQDERRPDLDEERTKIVEDIVARLDAQRSNNVDPHQRMGAAN
jgi:hypothetical protein